MKKNHRILAAALALLLCLSIAVAALAEAGPVTQMYQAAANLLFDTDNVSLTAHATFTYNGLQFKTLDADYAQAGADSKMTVHMESLTSKGRPYTGGYTVIANDGVAYSIEEYDPSIYSISGCGKNDSILTSTALRRTILSLGSAVAGATEGAFADKITVEQAAEGTQYHVQLAQGDAPQLINAAGTLLFQVAAGRFFYMDYDQVIDLLEEPEPEEPEIVEYCDVYYSDYDASVMAMYKKLFGEEMPENFYELIWDEDGNLNEKLYARYSKVVDEIYENVYLPLTEQYKTGVVLVYPDGTTSYYATEDEYMVANDLQYAYYDDYELAFCRYYEAQTGQPLTAQELQAIYYSGNNDLVEAYYDMSGEMDMMYEALVKADGKAAIVHVFTDGSYEMVYDIRDFWQNQNGGETVVYTVLTDARALELGQSDFTMTLDAEGRFTAAKGSVTIQVIDAAGESRPLVIDFDLAAGAYGETKVETFDPAVYNVCTWEEYMATDGGDYEAYANAKYEAFLSTLPETVTFNGVVYTVDAASWEDMYY